MLHLSPCPNVVYFLILSVLWGFFRCFSFYGTILALLRFLLISLVISYYLIKLHLSFWSGKCYFTKTVCFESELKLIEQKNYLFPQDISVCAKHSKGFMGMHTELHTTKMNGQHSVVNGEFKLKSQVTARQRIQIISFAASLPVNYLHFTMEFILFPHWVHTPATFTAESLCGGLTPDTWAASGYTQDLSGLECVQRNFWHCNRVCSCSCASNHFRELP